MVWCAEIGEDKPLFREKNAEKCLSTKCEINNTRRFATLHVFQWLDEGWKFFLESFVFGILIGIAFRIRKQCKSKIVFA